MSGVRFRLQRAHRRLDDLLDKIITECEARHKVPGDVVVGGEADDLLSVMLRIRDEGDLGFPINTTNIKAVVVVSTVALPFPASSFKKKKTSCN